MRKQDIGNKKYEKITISFTDADEDIIKFVKELKKSNKASEFIREAIREKIEENNDIIEGKNIQELKTRITLIEEQLIALFNSQRRIKVEGVKSTNKESVKEEIESSLINESASIDEDILNALSFFEL